MSVHGPEGIEDEVWQRFLELFVSAVIVEWLELNTWGDRAGGDTEVHDRVLSWLIIIAEKFVQQVWPSLKALLRTICLITESLFDWHGLDLIKSSTTAALCHWVTCNCYSDLILLWSLNLEGEFPTWKKGFLSLIVALSVAGIRETNFDPGHFLKQWETLRSRHSIEIVLLPYLYLLGHKVL